MKLKFLIIIFVVLVSCSQEKKTANNFTTDSTKINSNLILAPKSDSFEMKYNFNLGDVLNYRITTISTTSQDIIADSTISSISRQNVVYNIKLTIDKIDSAQNAKIDIIVNSIFVKGSVNGQDVNYNSNLIQSSQEKVMFSHYEATKKKTFSIIITNSGEIVNIFNYDSIIKELLAIQQQNNLTVAQKNEMKENFAVSVLRPLTEQIFRKFPTKRVSVNYSWVDKYYSQFALFQIENIASFQISEVKATGKDTTIIINAGLSINWLGDNKTSENGMNFYFYDPIVSGDGKIHFDKSVGLVSYSNTTTQMQMETDISGIDQNGKQINAKRIDNTKNTNIVELK